jgi:predicted DsbA family dithiol-disulfide isomerase
MLGELRVHLTADMGQDLNADFPAIQSIPRQAAKVLVLAAKNNGACMHMLNELWSKVYPELVVASDDNINNNNNNDDKEE